MKSTWVVTLRNCLIVVAAAAFLLGFATMGAAAQKYTLTYLTPWPKSAWDSAIFIDHMKIIQQEADKQYPGELNIVYQGGPEVIPTLEQVESLRKGVVDMLQAASSYYSSSMPELDVLGLSNMPPWEERKTGLFDYLDKLHNKKTNTHYLARVGLDIPFQIALRKAITTVDDLEGMKLRVSPTNIPFTKAVGGVPVQMPPPDIYTALERGVVDGYIIPAYTIRDFGLVKPTKFLVFPGLTKPTNAWLINLDTWEKLPSHLRNFLTEQTDSLERSMIDKIKARNDAELASFKKEGVQFIELETAQAEKLQTIAREALVGAVEEKAPEETHKILEFLDIRK
jgi:TRAP-type C4-dicarboxylate transport system substrate-binding protein